MQCIAAAPFVARVRFCLLLEQDFHIVDSLLDMVRTLASTHVLNGFYQDLQDKGAWVSLAPRIARGTSKLEYVLLEERNLARPSKMFKKGMHLVEVEHCT